MADSAKATEATEPKSLNLLYTPLNQSIRFEPSAAPSLPKAQMDARQIETVSFTGSIANLNTAPADSVPMPPQSKEPLRYVPMTVGEKFTTYFKGQFLSVGGYASALFSGFRGEAFDKDHDPNGDHGHFFADAGTRSARSFAFAATSKFFGRFLYASILRQDPRYHPSYKRSKGARALYAASRVFVTNGDKGGSQPNISFLAGGLTASYIANSWEREERTTTKKVFTRWGSNIAFTALSHVVREFLTGQ